MTGNVSLCTTGKRVVLSILLRNNNVALLKFVSTHPKMIHSKKNCDVKDVQRINAFDVVMKLEPQAIRLPLFHGQG